VLVASLLAAGSARGDLQIAGYEDRLHDRFYVGSDRAFIGTFYNWSGIGRIQDPSGTTSNWKQVTMISDNYFVTAEHNRPTRGGDPLDVFPKVRFYRTNDPNGEYWESEIALDGDDYQGMQIGTSDLWVGKLANSPPDWVMRYPLAKRHEATNYLSYTDNDLFIFGQDSPRSATSVRVGRNEVSLVYSSGNYEWVYNPTTGLGPSEAQTQAGDSGGPSFFVSGSYPVLAGIHTRVNFDTGISAKLQQIMDAVGEPISVSTGLPADVNGDFRLNPMDVFAIAANLGRDGARFYQGDVSGDGRVDVNDVLMWHSQAARLGTSGGYFAPADFDRDGDVDALDLATIGDHWLQSVGQRFTSGDANGDAFVNNLDVEMFDYNQYRAYFGPLPPPLSPITGDFSGNGIVDGFDLNVVTTHLNQTVEPGTNGDADGNGIVNNADVVLVATNLGDSFGDINSDHLVGPNDFLVLAANWNQAVTTGRLGGDMDGNGLVNGQDAAVLFGWWDMQGGSFPYMTIPEPSSTVLGMSGAVLAGLISRLKRRRLPV
jgi:hypothetical protein